MTKCHWYHPRLINIPIDVQFLPSLPHWHPNKCAIFAILASLAAPSHLVCHLQAFDKRSHFALLPSHPIVSFFLKKTMTISPAPKKGPGVQFPGCNLLMTSSSCAMTNQLYQLLLQFMQHLSHMSGCASIQVIILFGHLREMESHLSYIFHMESFGNTCQRLSFSQIFVPRKPNI
jgi:hypothetical protein